MYSPLKASLAILFIHITGGINYFILIFNIKFVFFNNKYLMK